MSLAWFLAVSARGGGLPLPGVPAPFVYPLDRLRAVLTLLLSSLLLPCVHHFFAACRVVMRHLWVSPRVFLIVYAPAMRRVAYYALGWGCSCARLAVWRCRASRVVVCGVAAHVCACGPFVVPLGRERGALASHSCSF